MREAELGVATGAGLDESGVGGGRGREIVGLCGDAEQEEIFVESVAVGGESGDVFGVYGWVVGALFQGDVLAFINGVEFADFGRDFLEVGVGDVEQGVLHDPGKELHLELDNVDAVEEVFEGLWRVSFWGNGGLRSGWLRVTRGCGGPGIAGADQECAEAEKSKEQGVLGVVFHGDCPWRRGDRYRA